MQSIQDLKKTQRLFSSTPKEKMMVFGKPSLWLVSGDRVIQEWKNTQPLYFYPFSVLDFLRSGPAHRELRIIDSAEQISMQVMRQFAGSKVHLEQINPHLISYAQELGCKVSLICNLEDINEENVEILRNLDFLIIRVNSPDSDLSVLKGMPNKKLLSGIRAYLSDSTNDFGTLAKKARSLGVDFIHISKRLIARRQEAVPIEDIKTITDLARLQTKSFKVVLPRDTSTVFNEKFVISEVYGNSRSCAFSRHRIVLFKGEFYPCYTRSILDSGRFASTTPESLRGISNQFGKTCTDCACIYENDLFDQISKVSRNIKRKKFFLGYALNSNAD